MASPTRPGWWGAGRRGSSVARQVLVLQVALVFLLVIVSLALAVYDERRDARATAAERVVAVARAVAASPAVIEALADADPSVAIQPYAETVRGDTSSDFVVVMALDRTRYSHPTEDLIGQPFEGDLGAAPSGGTFTQEYRGSLGPSMRSVVPVTDGGEVVALVSVGIRVAEIDRTLQDDFTLIGLTAGLLLLAGLLGAGLVNRRLRRQTHGLGEREITRMYEYYSAVLQAVREGLLLLDSQGRVQLVNDEATRLLDLPDDVLGRSLGDLGLAPGLVAAASGRTSQTDDLYVAGDRMLVVSSAPATWEGHEVGSVVTLRDHTELRAVTGELDVVRGLTESLRSQNHEAANRLHTVVSLIEMGRPDEAVSFATDELHLAQLLTDRMLEAVGDPVVSALLLGKSSEAVERGIELTVTGELPTGSGASSRELVTVLGNLVDNAFDAVSEVSTRRVRVELGSEGSAVRVVVGDSGPGLSDEDAVRVLERGWSTKATADGLAPSRGRGIGLALVAQVARHHRGRVDVTVSDLGGAQFTVILPEVRP